MKNLTIREQMLGEKMFLSVHIDDKHVGNLVTTIADADALKGIAIEGCTAEGYDFDWKKGAR